MQAEAIQGDHFKTLKKQSEGIYKEKGSKFLAFAAPVANMDEAIDFLNTIKASHHDARHHCFAYRINPEKPEIRMNDDGEPGNSAGTPIFNQILSAEIYNVIVIVVRYFGGTKLGVSGLMNAYKQAAAEAIANNEIIDQYLTEQLEVRFPYNLTGEVLLRIKNNGGNIIHENMAQDAGYIIQIRKSVKKAIIEQLTCLNNVNIV